MFTCKICLSWKVKIKHTAKFKNVFVLQHFSISLVKLLPSPSWQDGRVHFRHYLLENIFFPQFLLLLSIIQNVYPLPPEQFFPYLFHQNPSLFGITAKSFFNQNTQTSSAKSMHGRYIPQHHQLVFSQFNATVVMQNKESPIFYDTNKMVTPLYCMAMWKWIVALI